VGLGVAIDAGVALSMVGHALRAKLDTLMAFGSVVGICWMIPVAALRLAFRMPHALRQGSVPIFIAIGVEITAESIAVVSIIFAVVARLSAVVVVAFCSGVAASLIVVERRAAIHVVAGVAVAHLSAVVVPAASIGVAAMLVVVERRAATVVI
jgi:hypothetical protein